MGGRQSQPLTIQTTDKAGVRANVTLSGGAPAPTGGPTWVGDEAKLAGNAQFYLADIEYRQGNFDAAVKDYDKVLEQYPSGQKAAAAQLKKGYALLELGQKDAGVRELNSLIQRYPRSIEASQARDRLRRLGVSNPTSKH